MSLENDIIYFKELYKDHKNFLTFDGCDEKSAFSTNYFHKDYYPLFLLNGTFSIHNRQNELKFLKNVFIDENIKSLIYYFIQKESWYFNKYQTNTSNNLYEFIFKHKQYFQDKNTKTSESFISLKSIFDIEQLKNIFNQSFFENLQPKITNTIEVEFNNLDVLTKSSLNKFEYFNKLTPIVIKSLNKNDIYFKFDNTFTTFTFKNYSNDEVENLLDIIFQTLKDEQLQIKQFQSEEKILDFLNKKKLNEKLISHIVLKNKNLNKI